MSDLEADAAGDADAAARRARQRVRPTPLIFIDDFGERYAANRPIDPIGNRAYECMSAGKPRAASTSFSKFR
jgi:hypothetical protein